MVASRVPLFLRVPICCGAAWKTSAGGGDVEGAELVIGFSRRAGPGLQTTLSGRTRSLGSISLTIESRSKTGAITAVVQAPDRRPPAAMLVRFRHPAASRMRTVRVNRPVWNDFDPEKEWVRVTAPVAKSFVIEAGY